MHVGSVRPKMTEDGRLKAEGQLRWAPFFFSTDFFFSGAGVLFSSLNLDCSFIRGPNL